MNTPDSRYPYRVIKFSDSFLQIWTALNDAPGSRNNYLIADNIQSEAEAILLAAAPDLLAALKAITAILTQPIQFSTQSSHLAALDIIRGDCQVALQIAKEAISKSTQ